eukprot:COSAG02_NODE_34809_length_478_cov_0.633245_1_plen_37_part_01
MCTEGEAGLLLAVAVETFARYGTKDTATSYTIRLFCP